MIQISDTTTHPPRNLDEICEEHYRELEECIRGKIMNTPGEALQSFRDFLSDRLEEILKGKPERLIELHQKYRALETILINENNEYVGALLTGIVKKIFNYESFSKNKTSYNAYTLAKKLNFNTCPYCNRNYTVTVINDRNKKIVRPDFDHFFPKSRYPLLALSFFNLIPCCPICNRTLKGDKKMGINTHIHPYLEGFGQVLRFNYLPGDADSAVGMQNNIHIRFLGPDVPDDVDKLAKCRQNAALFQLEPIYTESHSAEVAEIVYKHHVSNGSYLRSLAETFPKIGGRDELYRLAFGNYYQEGDFDKRPLAKLTRDIFDQLNFLW